MNTARMSHQGLLEKFFSFTELSSLSRIAWPLILSSLVTMSVSITDVVMIGRLGNLELAAAAAASDFYSIFFYLAAGVAAAISALIAHARGKRQFREVKSIAYNGFISTMAMGLVVAVGIYYIPQWLAMIGVQSDIVQTGAPYAHMMALAAFPLLAVSVMHYILSALNKTRVILIVTAFSFPVNILGNMMFLYGSWGMPNLGLAGAALASAITGSFMFVSMLCYMVFNKRLRRYFYFPMLKRATLSYQAKILALGLPIGISHFGEMGVFLFTTVTMGIFGAEVLAAHTIALRITGVFYALPIGYAQAAMVRVAFLNGAKQWDLLKRCINTTMLFSLAAGSILLLAIIAVQDKLVPLFISAQHITPLVTAQASSFLLMVALMQPAVVVGTVGAGILRGLKDSKFPMYFSLASYWGFGFVGALILAFTFNFSGLGLWVGLWSATAVFAILVLLRIYGPQMRSAHSPLLSPVLQN